MWDKDRFIQDCHDAMRETEPIAAVRELVARAVSEPAQIVRALGEPTRGEVQTIYGGEDMGIFNLLWGPRMSFQPHDHRMWAIIGIYGGQEDNVFYRRGAGGLTRHGEKQLLAKDVIVLGENVIHSVSNPRNQITAAVHVYGGDFFSTPRSEWDPETFEERPYDFERTKRAFEESNALLDETAASSM